MCGERARTREVALALVEVTEPGFGVELDLVYASDRNFTGRPVYAAAHCFLRVAAAQRLRPVVNAAVGLGLRLRIFDAFRPTEAQWVLWRHTPDSDFLAPPWVGSPHSRGVALDLTLIGPDGAPLDMGTAFDAFTPLSHHGSTEVSVAARRNRLLLLGLMTAAGWSHYDKEWWHYQLPDSRRYPLISDSAVPKPLMTQDGDALAS